MFDYIRGLIALFDNAKWIVMGYNLPAKPSKLRVYVWRKIKDMGAVLIRPGIIVIPNDDINLDKFVSLQQKIAEMGGEAQLGYISFFDEAYETHIIDKFNSATKNEYSEIEENCNSILKKLFIGKNETAETTIETDAETEEQIKKVTKQYGKAKSRDHFSVPEGKNIETAINDILQSLKTGTDEFVASIKKMLDKYNKDTTNNGQK